MFASICLFSIEMKTWKQWRTMQMDMIDGLVHSEIQGESVERFEQAPTRPQRQASAVATGLGDDLEEKIRQRRAKAVN